MAEPKHSDRGTCKTCGGGIEFYEYTQSTGLGTHELLDWWWSHDVHPEDGHEAEPIEVCLSCGQDTCQHAECMSEEIDVRIVTLSDGRRVKSVNGQGHLPLDN